MKILDVRGKDSQKSFKQIRRWFMKNPNRHFARIKTQYTDKTIVPREKYVYPAQPPTKYIFNKTPLAEVVSDLI